MQRNSRNVYHFFCSYCIWNSAKAAFSYERSDYNVSTKTQSVGPIWMVWPRHAAFEGLSPLLEFDNFVATEKGASMAGTMQRINFKYCLYLVY